MIVVTLFCFFHLTSSPISLSISNNYFCTHFSIVGRPSSYCCFVIRATRSAIMSVELSWVHAKVTRSFASSLYLCHTTARRRRPDKSLTFLANFFPPSLRSSSLSPLCSLYASNNEPAAVQKIKHFLCLKTQCEATRSPTDERTFNIPDTVWGTRSHFLFYDFNENPIKKSRRLLYDCRRAHAEPPWPRVIAICRRERDVRAENEFSAEKMWTFLHPS